MKLLRIAAFMGFVLAFIAPAGGVPPAGFVFQGRLADNNGVNREGNFQMTFSIFDSESGGVLLWERLLPIVVRKGQFQVMVQGTGKNGDNADVTFEDAFGPVPVPYLETTLAGEQAMSPRQPLYKAFLGIQSGLSGPGDVPIAADKNSLGSGKLVLKTGGTDRMEIANSGNVGVGAANAAERLVVNGMIESLSGGLMFPDGSSQLAAMFSNCYFILRVVNAGHGGVYVPIVFFGKTFWVTESGACEYSNSPIQKTKELAGILGGVGIPFGPWIPNSWVSCSGTDGFTWKIDLSVCSSCAGAAETCGPITSITLTEWD